MQAISEQFKALADETRLRILALLLDGNEYCVCDIMEGLGLPQSTASRHLAYLKNNGWVAGRRQNKWMYYHLVREQNDLGRAVITALHQALPTCQQYSGDQQRLKAYLEQKSATACG